MQRERQATWAEFPQSRASRGLRRLCRSMCKGAQGTGAQRTGAQRMERSRRLEEDVCAQRGLTRPVR